MREPYVHVAPGNSFMFNGPYTHWVQLGGRSGCDNITTILRPEELWNIDTKMDDGKPALGKVRVRADGGISLCTTVANSATLTADYLLSSANKDCIAIFPSAF